MSRKNWRGFYPHSLREALEGCKDYALQKHNRSVEQIAELAGEESHWTVYGWMRDGSIPGKKIPAFQHACGCDFVTRWAAHSSGKLLIPIPTGRAIDMDDVHRLQGTLNAAVSALLGFAAGSMDADQVSAELHSAMEALAFHRENAGRHRQPGLELNNHD